jgi:small subunit ribosomal protein S14
MAKKGKIESNEKRKRLVRKYAKKRAELLAIARDRSRPIEERFAAQLKLAKLPRNSAPIRVRNRCELTGRPRGYYRRFRLSRIALRELANKGLLPGVTKSSW